MYNKLLVQFKNSMISNRIQEKIEDIVIEEVF